MRRSPVSLLLAAAVALAACSSGGDDGTTLSDTTLEPADAGTAGEPDTEAEPEDGSTTDDSATTTVDAGDAGIASAPIELPDATDVGEIRPGVEQVALVGAEPGAVVHVLPDDDEAVDAFLQVAGGGESEPPEGAVVDVAGSLLVRDLLGGVDYRFVVDGARLSEVFTTLERDDHPDGGFYAAQSLPTPGYGYVEMRDGTTLSVNVVLPGPVEDGPYPTVVEYSGYTPSNPDEVGLGALFTGLGYAYVGVNMRGTGCSGGSFRYFEYPQSVDGYDVVEAVAAQPWVQGNRVGLVGLSYPGISQLFVAQTQPPSLAAITPLSVVDDSYRSTLYPGGLLNTGFALEWTQSRLDDARPAPDGQSWAAARIEGGDGECERNQELRLQNPDLVAEIRANPYYSAALGDPLAPATFVDRITVPTFIAGAWQDEQTGGRFPAMLDDFTGTDRLFASLTNGLHVDAIGAAVFPRYLEFLELYVAERVPSLAAAAALTPLLAAPLFGTAEAPPFEDRFAGLDHGQALDAFEAEPPIRILFENGAADGLPPRAPGARFEAAFDAWPIPEVEARTWFLAGDRSLAGEAAEADTPVGYVADPDGAPDTFWDGNSSDLWRTDVEWNWVAPAAGTAAIFTSAPLPETLAMAGPGSVDLWLDTTTGDTDVEVTLSEVGPDGSETYVQSGWLRASQRAVDETASTALFPVHTHLESDAADLSPEGSYDRVRVALFPFAHVFRAGSQIRLTVDAPGGNRAVWEFESIAGGEPVTLGTGGEAASALVLPVVDGVAVPPDAPACGSLRGQPCRPG